MMAVVSFFVEKHRGIRHIVCRKTVYIRVKLHNYTLYAGIHTYFFVRSVKNAKKMSAVLLKMTHLNGKILDFEKGRKNSRCFYAENDDVVKQLRGRSFFTGETFFWKKKIQMRLLTFLPKTSKFLQKFNFVREKVQKSFRNDTDEKAVPSSF